MYALVAVYPELLPPDPKVTFTTGSPKLPVHSCAFIEKVDAKTKKTNIGLKKRDKGIWCKTGIFDIKGLLC
jgi:hypothetical protein